MIKTLLERFKEANKIRFFMIKIASWNINSIKARFLHLKNWLEKSSPDILLLQEIKILSDFFPYEEISNLGYNVSVNGQKTYNGVAILSKSSIEDVSTTLPGDETDHQARYIEGVVDNIRVASIYVPNGQEIGSDKYSYKLRFLDRVYKHTKNLLKYEEPLILGGDFNITFSDNDIYDPNLWNEKIMCSTEERSYLRKILYLGLTDAIKSKLTSSDQTPYTWWNYRTKAWSRNEGLRIDHLLLSPQASDVLISSKVDTTPRSWDRPSDHAPVICSLKYN